MRSLLAILLLVFSSQAFTKQAAIASAHPLATQAGREIIEQGGNAFDAAVAISAALAVVEPSGSGLGGGGFWLLSRAADGQRLMLDGRETAPSNAHRDMYLDQHGEVVPRLSLDGPLAAGIPGLPAALDKLATEYGSLPLASSLAPAIRYAEQGFFVDEPMQKRLQYRLAALKQSPAASAIFLRNGELPTLGEKIIQKDLAKTLQAVAAEGRAGFYQGKVAELLIAGSTAAGGIWTAEDLVNYQVVARQPVISQYHDWTITSAALPSSGGVVIANTLNILEQFDLQPLSRIEKVHLVAEAMRRSYRDRAAYLGDQDFVSVPQEKLLSDFYAAGQAQSIRLNKASKSTDLAPTTSDTNIGTDTTHFSVVDQYGNRVAATLSINLPFGSGFIPPGTGVLLNNEMDDFSIKPGSPNAYGLIGNEANAIAPNKRMLSSMSPSFVDGPESFAVIGTPGGSRIISMVALAMLDWVEHQDALKAVTLPRFHHQYLPDRIQFEAGAFNQQEQEQLTAMGHEMNARAPYGNMQIISKSKTLTAASDPRGIGKAEIFEISSSLAAKP